jgi:hypothetical protein
VIHTSYTCQSCQKTSFPHFILADKGPRAGKLVVECPNPECLRVDNALGPEHFNSGVAAIRDESKPDGEGWQGKRQVIVDTNADVATQTAQLAQVGATPSAPAVEHVGRHVVTQAAPKDIVTLLQEKSLALAAEEARLTDTIANAKLQLDATKAERKRIEKMLAVGRRDQARAQAANIDITSLRN